jgi:hypothetical protein
MTDSIEIPSSVKEFLFTNNETKEKLLEIKKSIAKEYISEIKK